MNSLVLSSPDLFDRTFADHFDRSRVRVVLPASGRPIESEPKTPQHRIYAFHQKILADLQKAWFQPLFSEHKALDSVKYEDELDSILDTMGSGWLVQDALLNHFLPLWLSRVDMPVLFLYFSEPLECALTLQQKWRFPISFGLALWESYMLAAVDNIKSHPCIPVSFSKLRQHPQKVIKSVHKQIRGIKQQRNVPITISDTNWPAPLTKSQPDLTLYSEFLQDSQRDIFSNLEKGSIQQLEGRVLKPQSIDILDYYSQLRAGFEMLKTKPDHFEKRVAQDNRKNKTATSLSSNPMESKIHYESASSLSEVTVHIRGMKPLELILESDSPVLQMLQHALQLTTQTPDKMVYLDYEDKGTSALYFMRSSLLGIEATPLSG